MTIYLDNHASTPIDPIVLQALKEAYEKFPGNPHSEHNIYGRLAKDAIDSSAEIISGAFKSYVEFSDIYFTSGATEANNLALIGTIEACQQHGNKKTQIIISAIEHKSVQVVAHMLARQYNMEILEVPVDKEGRVDLQFLKDKTGPQTAIVSIQGTNSEIGVNQDIQAINNICKKHGVVFHSDMTQSAYLEYQQGDNEIDLISISGHKRYGPQGIGALIANTYGMGEITPMILGGGQQNGIRPGTMPTALIVALGKAIEIGEVNKTNEAKRTAELRDNFIKGLEAKNVVFTINGSMKHRHPGNINITFENIDALDLICRTEKEMAISTSSACTSEGDAPSHVLQAIGLSDEQIRRTIRVGIGRFNTKDDIKSATALITSISNS